MKKLLTGVLLSACIATTAYAGGKHSDERRGGSVFPLHKMEKVLALTDEQLEKFDEMKGKRGKKQRKHS